VSDGARPRPASVPIEEFDDFLSRLHGGPPQHAAAVKVAVAVWQGAVKRGDAAGAEAALAMVREAVDRLIQSISEVQEHGRRLAGQD
jgi:hypothetical protein